MEKAPSGHRQPASSSTTSSSLASDGDNGADYLRWCAGRCARTRRSECLLRGGSGRRVAIAAITVAPHTWIGSADEQWSLKVKAAFSFPFPAWIGPASRHPCLLACVFDSFFVRSFQRRGAEWRLALCATRDSIFWWHLMSGLPPNHTHKLHKKKSCCISYWIIFFSWFLFVVLSFLGLCCWCVLQFCWLSIYTTSPSLNCNYRSFWYIVLSWTSLISVKAIEICIAKVIEILALLRYKDECSTITKICLFTETNFDIKMLVYFLKYSWSKLEMLG